VAHEAFGYLCNAYDLTQLAIEGLTPDSEPDPAKMQEVIEYAKKYDIHTIFFEELASPKVAKTVAKEVDAVTAVLNPIEGLSEEDIEAGEDYFSVMRKNLEALRKALN
jgi:zinc transport system substrate-binding protein